jgi:hypothetical protein
MKCSVFLSDYLSFEKWKFDRFCMTTVIYYKLMCTVVRGFLLLVDGIC